MSRFIEVRNAGFRVAIVGITLLLARPIFGDEVFVRTLNVRGFEEGHGIIGTQDGGIALAGMTAPDERPGESDLFLIRLDREADPLWARTLLVPFCCKGTSVVQTEDCGFCVGGYADDLSAQSGDVLLSKFDAGGDHLWTTTLGGTAWEECHAMIATGAGGFAVVGHTFSYGAGYCDVLISKFDSAGAHVWTKAMGGS